MFAECSEEEPEENDPVVEPPVVEPVRKRKPPVEVVIDEATPSERPSKVDLDQEDGWGQGLSMEPELAPTLPDGSSAPGNPEGTKEVEKVAAADASLLQTQDSQGTLVYPGWELDGISYFVVSVFFVPWLIFYMNMFMGMVRPSCQVGANFLGCVQRSSNESG